MNTDIIFPPVTGFTLDRMKGVHTEDESIDMLIEHNNTRLYELYDQIRGSQAYFSRQMFEIGARTTFALLFYAAEGKGGFEFPTAISDEFFDFYSRDFFRINNDQISHDGGLSDDVKTVVNTVKLHHFSLYLIVLLKDLTPSIVNEAGMSNLQNDPLFSLKADLNVHVEIAGRLVQYGMATIYSGLTEQLNANI